MHGNFIKLGICFLQTFAAITVTSVKEIPGEEHLELIQSCFNF